MTPKYIYFGVIYFFLQGEAKYPLKTNKYSDYMLFKEVVMMMQDGKHLTAEGLQKIINISSGATCLRSRRELLLIKD